MIRSARSGVVLLAAMGMTGCPEGGSVGPDPDPLVIQTTSLPDGAIGEAYSAGIDAEGGEGAYEWTVSAGLPPGLAFQVDDLTDPDAIITGDPVTEGTFAFRVTVTSEDGQSRSRDFSIDILGEPDPLAVTTIALAPALVGAGYEARLEASGGDGTFAWSLPSGTLPPGLTLTTTGRIQGTPTAPDTAVIVVRATSAGIEAERAYTLAVVANRTGAFDITVAPVVPVPAAIQPHLDAAIARWQAAITGDLPVGVIPAGFFSANGCSGFGRILNGTAADDVIVLVNITPIDGPGQILGQAGPCVLRGNNIPFGGVLTLDAADLGQLTNDHVVDLIVHELGHVLGFGSLWDRFGLLAPSASDPRYTGSQAVAEWQALGQTGDVPVENQGGQGTANSHWRESVFNAELMTGFAEGGNTEQPLSRVSIAAMADMGYAVNLGAADAFNLAPAMSPAAAAADRERAAGWDVLYDGPIYRIEDNGVVTIVQGEE